VQSTLFLLETFLHIFNVLLHHAENSFCSLISYTVITHIYLFRGVPEAFKVIISDF